MINDTPTNTLRTVPSHDVVCFGETIVDLFPRVLGVPLRQAVGFDMHLGGAPANVAVGLARLGHRVALHSSVGDDEFGAFLRDRLAEALRRVRQARWSAGAPAPVEPAPQTGSDDFLTGHRGRAIESIPVRSLLFIQVESGTAWAHTVDGSRTRLAGGLTELLGGLPSASFVQVSRSAVVHTERVLRLRPVGSSFEVELEGGHRVAVSRRRVKLLEAAIGLG